MAKSMDTMPRNRWSRSGETGGHDGAKFAAEAPAGALHGVLGGVLSGCATAENVEPDPLVYSR